MSHAPPAAAGAAGNPISSARPSAVVAPASTTGTFIPSRVVPTAIGAPAAAAPPAAAPAPVVIPRLQLSSWGAATEDEQSLYGARPRLSARQAIAAAKEEAAAADAAAAIRQRNGYSPRQINAVPTAAAGRRSTSPSASTAAASFATRRSPQRYQSQHPDAASVSKLHLSPGRRVSVSPGGRSASGISPRTTGAMAGYTPRGTNHQAGSSPRSPGGRVPPVTSPPRGSAQRSYSPAQARMPAVQPMHSVSPRSPRDARPQSAYAPDPRRRSNDFARIVAAAPGAPAAAFGGFVAKSPAEADLLRRLSELEVDLRARLHALHVEFESIKDHRAQRDQLQDGIDNLEAALTAFPFACDIRQQLIEILRTPAPAAATTQEERQTNGLNHSEPLRAAPPATTAAREAGSAQLVHSAPSEAVAAAAGVANASNGVRSPAQKSQVPKAQQPSAAAPVPAAKLALPSLSPSAEQKLSAANASSTIRPDEASQAIPKEPRVIRRPEGGTGEEKQSASVDRHPNLADSVLSASTAVASDAAAPPSLTTSLNSSFPVHHAPLSPGQGSTASVAAADADDPLDKLLVFPAAPAAAKR